MKKTGFCGEINLSYQWHKQTTRRMSKGKEKSTMQKSFIMKYRRYEGENF
jgi:hypothetical protein